MNKFYFEHKFKKVVNVSRIPHVAKNCMYLFTVMLLTTAIYIHILKQRT